MKTLHRKNVTKSRYNKTVDKVEKMYGKPKTLHKNENPYYAEFGPMDTYNTGHTVVGARVESGRDNSAYVVGRGHNYEGEGSASRNGNTKRRFVDDKSIQFSSSTTTNKSRKDYDAKKSPLREARKGIKDNTNSLDVARYATNTTLTKSQIKRGRASGKGESSSTTRPSKLHFKKVR